MSALPPPDAAVEKRWCEPFAAQLLDLITDEPGISTVELADRLNQTKGRAGKYLARLRQAGLLTALIPKMSNRPYRWTLAGYSPPPVELQPEPIAATTEPAPEPIITLEPESEPEPVITPEPVAEDIDNGDEEAGFSVATLDSALLPKGLTPEDLEWHRYWQSRAMQRACRLAQMETV